MLELNRLRNDREAVAAGLAKRGVEIARVDAVIDLDDRRKREQAEADALRKELKDRSAKIGEFMKAGKTGDAQMAKDKVTELKRSSAAAEARHKKTVAALEDALYALPNIPHESVPAGKSADDNEVVREPSAALPVLPKGAKPHWDLGKKYGIIDLEAGVQLSGAGFVVYRGQGARLQRALINFFLDRAAAAGYTEVQVPHLVNETSARATGQLPDKEGQMYHVTEDDLYLIPTAEVPITNLLRGDTLQPDDLPVKYCGYTPCFRREAGSYGAHVRGLNRVHQFDKVEIVRVEDPEKSYAALEEMVAHVSSLLDELGLPYRVLRLCGGDMGFTAALTYDFEVWSAAQKQWLEVSSVSNFETYQSNRLALRLKDGKKKSLAHTLNGSALALPRILAALLENNQRDGGIDVPEALRPYAGFDAIQASA